jgi:peptidyl-tRNA hydrolase
MVLAVRADLKMGKGKIGAQCGHATLGAHFLSLARNFFPTSFVRIANRGVQKSNATETTGCAAVGIYWSD